MIAALLVSADGLTGVMNLRHFSPPRYLERPLSSPVDARRPSSPAAYSSLETRRYEYAGASTVDGVPVYRYVEVRS